MDVVVRGYVLPADHGPLDLVAREIDQYRSMNVRGPYVTLSGETALLPPVLTRKGRGLPTAARAGSFNDALSLALLLFYRLEYLERGSSSRELDRLHRSIKDASAFADTLRGEDEMHVNFDRLTDLSLCTTVHAMDMERIFEKYPPERLYAIVLRSAKRKLRSQRDPVFTLTHQELMTVANDALNAEYEDTKGKWWALDLRDFSDAPSQMRLRSIPEKGYSNPITRFSPDHGVMSKKPGARLFTSHIVEGVYRYEPMVPTPIFVDEAEKKKKKKRR